MSHATHLVVRCHEIQTTLRNLEVPEFETIPELGMAVRLALHLQGLPLVAYETLKLVANHFLGIPKLAIDRIVHVLAEVEFVRLQKTGSTITAVLPTVPFYDELYVQLGQFATNERRFNEPEQLALHIVERLAKSPEKVATLQNSTGADPKLFKRSLDIGTAGSYLIKRRFRGRDVLISPTYFAENTEVFADAVAASGATTIGQLMLMLSSAQGWPLRVIEQQSGIGREALAPDQIQLLKRLAEDGAVKPPSIVTTHAGTNYFMFTPTPAGAALSPGKRNVYEKAMAIVAAVRQGQLLPNRYAIHSPGALIYRLKENLQLTKATTEARQQYKNLTSLRIAWLEHVGNGYSQLRIIDTPENREALDIAYDLVTEGRTSGMEIDDGARQALQQSQEYVESLIAAAEMRRNESVPLSAEQQEQMDLLFIRGFGV